MISLPLRYRRALLVPAGLLVSSTPLHAQAGLSRANGDSVSLLPAIAVPAATTGAFVAVLDSATIASSGARTLSELLLARVPGLSVRHRGGTEADGFEISSRGMGPAGYLAPLLIIDGVMASAQQGLPVPGTSVTISRLDDLTPAEVQRIEVLRGPAASALYGVGASAGVIVVTTRRGSAGPLTIDVNAGAGLAEMGARFPANYQLTNGTPHQYCNPRTSSTMTVTSCAPMTLFSWNPLEQASPFRVGHSVAGGAAVSGTTRGIRLFGGLSAERVSGVTDYDQQSRINVHGSAERELPGHVSVSVQGSYLQRDATIPARGAFPTSDNVIFRGLRGSAYDDSLRGYARPAGDEVVAQEAPALSRVVGALHVTWKPLGWLSVDALGGRDHALESATRTTRITRPSGTWEEYAILNDRWTSGTMHAAAMARFATPMHGVLATYLAYDDVRMFDRTTDSSGGVAADYATWTRTWRRINAQEVTVRQHAAWGDIVDVNAGARFSVGRGVSKPFGLEAARSVDASVRLPSPRPDIELRLRGAAGLAPVVPRGTRYVAPAAYGGLTLRPLRSRQGEREGGIDAAFGTRARVEATWFSAQARDTYLGTAFMYAGDRPLIADFSHSGIEATASAQLLEGTHLGWRSTLTIATLRSNVTRMHGAPWFSYNGSLTPGYPLQGYWSRDYQWSDANGDGLVSVAEVTPLPSSHTEPSRPTLEVGMHNAVTLPRGVTVSGLLDYRHGQYRDNGSEASRCRGGSRICEGMQDVTMPLADQARWSAVSAGYIDDVVPASYLRLREVIVEWAPEARRAAAHRLAVRVIGQNLLTWTEYDGVDPEVGASSFLASEAPQELFQSPLSRRVRVEVRMGVR
jgi:TonB-dependent SusC/RagA subfamily outer membrane receptor